MEGPRTVKGTNSECELRRTHADASVTTSTAPPPRSDLDHSLSLCPPEVTPAGTSVSVGESGPAQLASLSQTSSSHLLGLRTGVVCGISCFEAEFNNVLVHCLCVVRFLLGVIPVSLPEINSLSMYMSIFIICIYLQFILYIYIFYQR